VTVAYQQKNFETNSKNVNVQFMRTHA